MLPFEQPSIIDYSRHMAESYTRFTGRALSTDANTLYHAPFALVSHGTESDPIFRYANLTAQTLWGMEWDAFTKLPSRLSAQPDAREERDRLLARAQSQGYVDDYRGVRVTSAGKLFRIENCTLWNVHDDNGQKIGQAAMFDRWEWL